MNIQEKHQYATMVTFTHTDSESGVKVSIVVAVKREFSIEELIPQFSKEAWVDTASLGQSKMFVFDGQVGVSLFVSWLQANGYVEVLTFENFKVVEFIDGSLVG